MKKNRIENEIKHGKFLAENGAGEIWNWETPAGKIRWARRVNMLTNHVKKEDKVLEIGCGTGYFTKQLAKTNAHIIAIDISPDLLDLARIETKQFNNVIYKLENAYELTFGENEFDTIVGSSVLHHLDVNKALSEFFRVLKTGGVIKFTEPNMLNPQIAIQKNVPFIKKRLGDSPDETAFFKSQIKRKLKRAGFKSIEIKHFDFLHPSIPENLISTFKFVGNVAESIPVIRKISGSLFIEACK